MRKKIGGLFSNNVRVHQIQQDGKHTAKMMVLKINAFPLTNTAILGIGHQQLFKGSLFHHHKEVFSRIAESIRFFDFPFIFAMIGVQMGFSRTETL